MTQIIQQLGPELKKALKEAEEVWVAVALMNEAGLNQIQEHLPSGAKRNFVLGVNLPTHPSVLETLRAEELKLQGTTVRLYQGIFFHPKLYMIKGNNQYVAFLGSANSTDQGFNKNKELSVKLEGEEVFQSLLKVFQDYLKNSYQISPAFLTRYWKLYKKRKELESKDLEYSKIIIDNLDDQSDSLFRNRRKLINDLLKFKSQNNFSTISRSRNREVKKLRGFLDHPNFNNIDVDSFFNKKELGTLMPYLKNRIKKNPEWFREYLVFLSDNSIDIAKRYQEAFDGKHYVKGMRKAFISKIMTINDPINCWVQNDISMAALKKYGMEFPRKMTAGERYKAVGHFLKKTIDEVGIKNMAILDDFLYTKGSK
jgi:HKD family nuclease